MICRMVDGLDQHDAGGYCVIYAVVEDVECPLFLSTLHNGDQRFPCRARALTQCIESRKGGALRERGLVSPTSKAGGIAPLSGTHVQERLPDTAKCSSHAHVELFLAQRCACIEQAQVRPEVMPEKVNEPCGHALPSPLLRQSCHS